MKTNDLSTVVALAKLWGLAVADAATDKDLYMQLEAWDSDELAQLLSSWAEEYAQREYEDLCDFFDEKMSELFDPTPDDDPSAKYPVLFGHYNDVVQDLHNVQEVADFIMEYGVKGDLVISQENGMPLITTFGIYINKIADMEYREELLKVLMPMQMALDGSENF